jgi:hypothetical protein
MNNSAGLHHACNAAIAERPAVAKLCMQDAGIAAARGIVN